MTRALVIVALDAAAWAVLSAGVGLAAQHVPERWIARDIACTRLLGAEAGGALWRRVHIDRWKDHLPEAGGTFGGVSKRSLRRSQDLDRFVLETRRAELVHWFLLACGPVVALANPPGLAAAMIGYAVVANVPCLVVQRYNRARLYRLLARRRRRKDLPCIRPC